jgi:N-acetylneuraminic acid mutarotase
MKSEKGKLSTTRSNLLQLALVFAIAACGETATEPSGLSVLSVSAAAAVSNSWITRLDLPSIERSKLAAATVPNAAGQSILYAIGGRTESLGTLGKVQAYNAGTNTWSYKASLPVPLYFANGAAVIRGKIYVSGGVKRTGVYSAELYVYDPPTNKWTRKADMPHETFAGVSGVINGQLYVLASCPRGDCHPTFPYVGFFRYDPVADRWTMLPRLMRSDGSHIDHYWGMGGAIGGKFYVGGGPGTNRLDVYDPVTDQWTERASMPSIRYDAAGLAFQGKLYVIGGLRREPGGASTPVRTTSVYDPITDTWTNKAPLPTARTGIAGSRVVVNGQPRVEVVGGTRPGNNLQYIP